MAKKKAKWTTGRDAFGAYLQILQKHGRSSSQEQSFWRDPRLSRVLSAKLARRLLGLRRTFEVYREFMSVLKDELRSR